MPERTVWVVLADGSRALIYASVQPGGPLDLVKEMQSEEARKPTRDLGTDRPGRTKESATGDTMRHGYDDTDWHSREKQKFHAVVAATLDEAAKAEAFHELVLVAGDRSLADFRSELSRRVAERVIHEINKDFTRLPIADLRQQLSDVIPISDGRVRTVRLRTGPVPEQQLKNARGPVNRH